jgi:hypothetical protein
MPNTIETQELTTADLANAGNRSVMEAEDTERRQSTNRSNDPYAGHLLPEDTSGEMRTHWESIQTAFVDDPREAVHRADELVASAIQKLAGSFADERAKLEKQWSSGNAVDTEDLRQALQRYRAFFHRLLSI